MIRPLHDYVAITRDEKEQVSAGGILLSAPHLKHQDHLRTGKVVAIGEGKYGHDGKLRPMQAKVGDRVAFLMFKSTEIALDQDTKVLMVSDENIVGVL